MALSANFIEAHVARWENELNRQFYPHRKHWPSHLFHHAPLDNAVAILRDGCLRSRNDAQNQRARDIAAPGVIDARTHAHHRVRLYFRPKTPTQWHIEGIRKDGECGYGNATHAEILIMFALDARSVLALPDIMFSDQNMQLQNTVAGDTEDYFSAIDFSKVFSEGSTGGDRSYTDARCAEVLPISPLPLGNCLRAIYLRSEAERDTLLYALGDLRDQWSPLCHVSDALKVFQKEYTFVQELRLTRDGVVFRMNPRKDGQSIAIKIDVWRGNEKVVDFYNDGHEATPKHPALNWIWRRELDDGIYLVEIRLEGCLAHRSYMTLGDSLF